MKRFCQHLRPLVAYVSECVLRNEENKLKRCLQTGVSLIAKPFRFFYNFNTPIPSGGRIVNKEMLNLFSHNFNNKILLAIFCVEIICSFKAKNLDWIIEKIFQTYKMFFFKSCFYEKGSYTQQNSFWRWGETPIITGMSNSKLDYPNN